MIAQEEDRSLRSKWLRCDQCKLRGIQYWANNHAMETGHDRFTIEPLGH